MSPAHFSAYIVLLYLAAIIKNQSLYCARFSVEAISPVTVLASLIAIIIIVFIVL